MRNAFLVAVVLVLIGGMVVLPTTAKASFEITGTVCYYPSLELGFWGVRTDAGTNYNPVNLPEELRKVGLRVKLTVKLRTEPNVRMRGKQIEIIDYESLGQGSGALCSLK